MVDCAREGDTGDSDLSAQAGDADGRFSGEGLSVEFSFGGDAEIGGEEAVGKSDGFHDDLDS